MSEPRETWIFDPCAAGEPMGHRKFPPVSIEVEEWDDNMTDVSITVWTPRCRVFVNTDLVSDDLTK